MKMRYHYLPHTKKANRYCYPSTCFHRLPSVDCGCCFAVCIPFVSDFVFLLLWQCRMMIAWPQACVAAYHVAYAENPQNPKLGTLIPEHLRELQAMAADQDRPRVIHSSDDIDNS